MAPYTNEEFYKDIYLSGRKAVITAAFSFYAMQATAEIKLYTGNNVNEENIPDEVQHCCCEIAELMYKDVQTEEKSGGASSESVQGWSVSYESAEARKLALQRRIKNCIYKWLATTGLLYRGVKRC